MQRQARLFRLVRHTDPSGVRGTGTLAEGVEWSDGAVALRWRGPWPSTSTWDGGIDAVLAAHGTGGRTQIHWFPQVPTLATKTSAPEAIKAPPPGDTKAPVPAERVDTVWLPAPGVDGLCSRCGRPWPCLSCGP
ncbi:hypothetical protein AB0L70_19825 [Kribbella sp. NPDC051952]|uniref:hypothetical protein n=1 Tax=Kribbella sp. NPDC051952 TaxID=3154851 RepID=UPI003422BCB3